MQYFSFWDATLYDSRACVSSCLRYDARSQWCLCSELGQSTENVWRVGGWWKDTNICIHVCECSLHKCRNSCNSVANVSCRNFQVKMPCQYPGQIYLAIFPGWMYDRCVMETCKSSRLRKRAGGASSPEGNVWLVMRGSRKGRGVGRQGEGHWWVEGARREGELHCLYSKEAWKEKEKENDCGLHGKASLAPFNEPRRLFLLKTMCEVAAQAPLAAPFAMPLRAYLATWQWHRPVCEGGFVRGTNRRARDSLFPFLYDFLLAPPRERRFMSFVMDFFLLSSCF